MSCCCLWHPFKLADKAHSWLCSLWVAAVPGTLSSMLTKPTLDSADSELLLSLTPFQASWQNSPLTLQRVSCCCPWHPFKLADKAHLWLCRKWVAAISDTLSSLLTRLTLDSAVCELLLSPAPFQACWQSSPLDLQAVSACYLLTSFASGDEATLDFLGCRSFIFLLSWLFKLILCSLGCECPTFLF